MRRLLALTPLVLFIACAHLPPPPGSDEEARNFGMLYLKALRWEGPRASASLLAPELQREYLDTIKADKLEQRLKITEYDPKEMGRIAGDAVTMVADMSWYYDPEVTVHHEEVTLHLRYRGGHWMVDGIDGGPLPIKPLVAPPNPTSESDGGAP